ncbi:MAG TPA: SDR family oxidoreductase [Enhygromyxa sp.]|nr:SDR family oxidoreductase [Enhygromyxa sp.]
MTHWQDKVVFITGAGSGIGRALAVALAQRGAKLTVTDINGDAASQTAQACGGHARKLALDVRDAAAVAAAVDEAAEAGGRLDVIFNNAGIGIAGETHELDVAHFDRILDINVRGVVHGVMAAYPRMVAQGFGQIVNTASLAGLGPAPFFTPYAMTKHAVVGLSLSLRAEASGLGVRVNALCPAAIETPILDSSNPVDLPQPKWTPDARALLTKLAGPPYSLERFTQEALRGLERNAAVIVIPSRARVAWRMGRWMPAAVEKACADVVADFRRRRAG